MSLTADPNDPALREKREPGQQNKVYLVLSDEERAKGFVRPVRRSYIHRGLPEIWTGGEPMSADNPTRRTESLIRKATKGCGTVTTMGLAIAETYARNPRFYTATFCCGCGRHILLEEFVWDGTDEEVGS